MKKLNKNGKILIISIGVIITLSLIINITYSYWQITQFQVGKNSIETGCFDITFEETGNDISLKNAFPISDEKGKNNSPYKFKIKNICNIDAEYYITLNSFGEQDKLLDECQLNILLISQQKTII